jgi:serine/threonine protein kinase
MGKEAASSVLPGGTVVRFSKGRKLHLHHTLGEGGMSVVRLGVLETPGEGAQYVAAKMFTSVPGSRQGAARETAALMRLDKVGNPHVTKIRLSGTITRDNIEQLDPSEEVELPEEGIPVVLMDLRGNSVARDIAQGMSLERIGTVVRGMVVGLSAAHRLGIVHRDVKPANVFASVGDNPGGEEWAMGDWSSALHVSDPPADRFSDVVIGSPRYMAPEVVADPYPPILETDIFGASVVVDELAASGQSPFPGKNIPQVIGNVFLGRWVPLSNRVQDAVRLSQVRPLGEVAKHGMDPDPRQRFHTMGELGDAVEVALAEGASDAAVERTTIGQVGFLPLPTRVS